MDDGIPETNQHKQSKIIQHKNVFLITLNVQHCLSDFILPFYLSCSFVDSYVIKLFDRSVDLAQFNTSTPLYPICRAWMRNNPSVREPAAYPSPSHSMVEEEVRHYCGHIVLKLTSYRHANVQHNSAYSYGKLISTHLAYSIMFGSVESTYKI